MLISYNVKQWSREKYHTKQKKQVSGHNMKNKFIHNNIIENS